MRWILRLLFLVWVLIGLGRLALQVEAKGQVQDNQVQVVLHLAVLPYSQCDSLVDRQIRQKAGCLPVDKYQLPPISPMDSESLTLIKLSLTIGPMNRVVDSHLLATHQTSYLTFLPIKLWSINTQAIRYSHQFLSYTRPPPLYLMV